MVSPATNDVNSGLRVNPTRLAVPDEFDQIESALMFIHLKTRRVMLSPATFNPNWEWMLQHARNLLIWLEDEGLGCLHLIHDNDTKFTAAFSEFLRQAEVKPLATPIAAPIANCYAESWIGGFKRECLNLAGAGFEPATSEL